MQKITLILQYIGNIVTTSKIEIPEYFNIVKDYNSIIPDIPTLIIGWNKVNTIFSNVKILEWKIDKNTYWTFGRREKGEKYLDDLQKFQQICLKKLFTTIKYSFFNVLLESEEARKQLFKQLKNINNKAIYIENNLLYCYLGDNVVYGISLTDIDYKGGSTKKLLSMLYGNKNTKIIFPLQL